MKSFTDHASVIRLSECSKLAINQQNDNKATICRHDTIVKFSLTLACFSLKFSCWSKFHVIIITGSRVMIIFVYKRWTRNPESVNSSIRVSPNTWRLKRVRDTKIGTNISSEILLNVTNFRITAVTVSELLRETQ